MRRKLNNANVLFFPVSDSQIPEVLISTLFGNALIGGMVQPSFVSNEQFVYLPSVCESNFKNFFIESVSQHSIELVRRNLAMILEPESKTVKCDKTVLNYRLKTILLLHFGWIRGEQNGE